MEVTGEAASGTVIPEALLEDEASEDDEEGVAEVTVVVAPWVPESERV